MGWSVVGTWGQTPAIDNSHNEGLTHNDDGTEMDNEQSQQNSQTKQPVPVQEFCFDKPTIIVIGNEGEGIPEHVLSQCDEILTVWNQTNDEHPVLDSLNVSVATGIILHSMALARKKNQ